MLFLLENFYYAISVTFRPGWFIVINYSAIPKMVIIIYFNFFPIFLKVLELFKCHRGDPYITANKKFLRSLVINIRCFCMYTWHTITPTNLYTWHTIHQQTCTHDTQYTNTPVHMTHNTPTNLYTWHTITPTNLYTWHTIHQQTCTHDTQ